MLGRRLFKDTFKRTPVLSKEIGGTLLEKDQAPAFQRRKPRPRRLSDFPTSHSLQAQVASCGKVLSPKEFGEGAGEAGKLVRAWGPASGIDTAFPA